jgi:hypothetical protein
MLSQDLAQITAFKYGAESLSSSNTLFILKSFLRSVNRNVFHTNIFAQ